MFNNLVESDTHIADIKRRGSFLMATMLAYALLLLAAGVGSIYAYEAHVDNQSLELTALVTMVPIPNTPARSAPPRAANPQTRTAAANADNTAQVSTRTIRQSSVTDMTKIPDGVAVTGNNAPPALPDSVISTRNVDVGGGGSSRLPFSNDSGTGGGSAASSGGKEITGEAPPELPRRETRPPQPRAVQSLGVIESKVIRKAVPPYPELAKRAHASGPVPVQILLDEQGRVISARATGGHPLLRSAAEQAAYQTRFSPTLLSNQPVKVSGVITFNFVLQ